MKNLTLLALTIAFYSISFSQTNNFAPVGAKWWYSDLDFINYEDTVFGYGYVLFESVQDTILNSISCRKVTTTAFGSDGSVTPGLNYFFYEDSGKVFCYDFSDEKFHLLYDFSGNNWFAYDFYYGSGDSSLVIVDSTSTELIDGIPLKKIYVSHDFSTTDFFTAPVIEKIGAFSFMFLYSGTDDSYPPSGLRCYQDNEIFYKTSDTPCDSLFSEIYLSDNFSANIKIRFLNNRLLIENKFNIKYTLSIFNITGQVLLLNVSSESQIINMENYESNLLIINLNTKDSSRTYKILKL